VARAIGRVGRRADLAQPRLGDQLAGERRRPQLLRTLGGERTRLRRGLRRLREREVGEHAVEVRDELGPAEPARVVGDLSRALDRGVGIAGSGARADGEHVGLERRPLGLRAAEELGGELEARRGGIGPALREIDVAELGEREPRDRRRTDARGRATRRIEEQPRLDVPAAAPLRRTTDEPRHRLEPHARQLRECRRLRDRRRRRLERLAGRIGREQRSRQRDQRCCERLAALLGELRGLTRALDAIGRQAEREVGAGQLAEQARRDVEPATAREHPDLATQLCNSHQRHVENVQRVTFAAMSRDDEARVAVERAEAEPLLAHRGPAVRALIDAAAPLLDTVDSPELRARLMLRLAEVKLVEADWDAADRALEAAGRHAGDGPWKLLAALRACRVAIRRGPIQRAEAAQLLAATAQLLAATAQQLPQLGSDLSSRRVLGELALAIAEVEIHADAPDATAFDALAELAAAAPYVDTAFTARQLLAAYALTIGDAQAAQRALRAVVKLTADAGSPADEVEARLAFASALLAGGDERQAAHHAQVAVDRALEHHLSELHAAALIAQAGILSAGGKTAGALDRVLELAREAAARNDVRAYVASVGIMAELYANARDYVSAFRTVVESHHALAAASGTDVTAMFRPLLVRLRERVGEARFTQIAADVDRANRLAADLVDRKPSNPS